MQTPKRKPDQCLFISEIARRGITRVVHFTPTINLLSIFEQGALLSRQNVKRLSIEHPDLYIEDYTEINDKLRLDNLNDYINLSIQHPNYALFRRFREAFRNRCDSWCVIALNPQCICFAETLFSIGNAAASHSKACGIQGTFNAFCSLFGERVVSTNVYGQTVHTRANLEKCYTTDPQAEVLVKESISTSYFAEVHFETPEEAKRANAGITVLGIGNLPPFKVTPSLFKNRSSNG